MRDINIFLHMSLDGIVEGPKGAMDIGLWPTTKNWKLLQKKPYQAWTLFYGGEQLMT